MKNAIYINSFLFSFLYHLTAFSDQVDENREIEAPVLSMYKAQLIFPQRDSLEKYQETQTVETAEKCEYFLITGFENDNFMNVFHSNDNRLPLDDNRATLPPNDDGGYTHGHLTRIVRSCDSAKDTSFSLDSRLFTQFSHFNIIPPDKVQAIYRFEEENRLAIEHTNWRNFKGTYTTVGLLVGHSSRDKLRLAGKEQWYFHEALENGNIIEYIKKQKQKVGSMRKEEQKQIMSFEGDIFEYAYIHEDKNVLFVGGKAAFGKSYSLSEDVKETCDNRCLDYFRTELGLELTSIKKASHVYLLLEMNKALPQPIDTVSFHAGLKAQKHESSYSGLYAESSVGLKFDIWGFQLQYLLKARNLLPEEDRFIEYDDETDVLIFLGVQTSF